jgi:dTDP-4-dehydrorhamnose reductase
MLKTILITGANGQLGSELQRLFHFYPQFRFLPTDINSLNLLNKKDIELFFSQNSIDYIIHCAAYTAVDKAEDDPDLCYAVNRDAVGNLAEAAQGKSQIIHISTDYVFDGSGNIPLKETDRTHPQSVYGKSKWEGEAVLMKMAPESIIIRTAWLYSAFGNNFVKTMIRLGKEKNSINVVSDQFGTPTYAADLAAVLLSVIDQNEKTAETHAGIYHYSNEGVCSWYDFCVKIYELTGITCKVNPISTAEYPVKATRPMYSVLDKNKIKATFQLEIPEWETSLEKCLYLIT